MKLTPDQGRRPVDAGWQIVCSQVHRRLRPTAIEQDPWIERGHHFLQALLDCRDDADREELARQAPDVHAAYNLFRSDSKFLRGRLEGYLLTGCPFPEIAQACGLSLAAVEAYERLFFWVRERLKARICIATVAFDDKFWDGMTADDVDLLLKKAGLLGGKALLERMIRYYTSGWRVPKQLAGQSHEQLSELYSMFAVHGLILAWVQPIEENARVEFVMDMCKELKKLVDDMAACTAAPARLPFGLPADSADLLESWWSSWQKTIQLAAGKLPDGTLGKMEQAA
jgi:hypothetical protein